MKGFDEPLFPLLDAYIRAILTTPSSLPTCSPFLITSLNETKLVDAFLLIGRECLTIPIRVRCSLLVQQQHRFALQSNLDP